VQLSYLTALGPLKSGYPRRTGLLLIGFTVFCGTQNFEPSCGICPFPRNFCVFTEYCRIQYWLVI